MSLIVQNVIVIGVGLVFAGVLAAYAWAYLSKGGRA